MSLKFLVFAVLVAASFAQHANDTFDNEWDGQLNFTCPVNEVLNTVYSIYDGQEEDRRWRLGCKLTPGNTKPRTCHWTADYVNDWDRPVMFLCPANYMIAGIQSVHDDQREDRRMKFRCCRRHGVKTRSCSITDYINDWGAPMNYTVTRGKVLTGWFSFHDDQEEDRLHKMVECKLE